jgi:hypothetical protein
MKAYDSIEYYGDYWGLPVIAFDKLDGSNIRCEYSQKRGFYKFGTRRVMIDRTNEDFGFAIDLFLEKYGEGLEKVFKSKEYRNIPSFVCFAELVGKKSAFGQHSFGDDEFDIVLFDVSAYKKGFIHPRQFVNDFGHLGIPRIVYDGNLNSDLVKNIKENKWALSEGVICKGVVKTKKSQGLYYCKIKTNDWFDRLRAKDIELYQEEINQTKIF